ncbi:MAG: hypothetical protein NUV84_00890 [Candidatus Uhrbacteria bacterium]|nr:hypothetical protein [Candidatus Uhrbacteria bacterium]
MSNQRSTNETLWAVVILVIIASPLFFILGFLGIEEIESRLDAYPIISEQTIRLRSLHSDFFTECHERDELQRKLWYRQDQISEETTRDLRQKIVLLDGELEAIHARCEEQSKEPCESLVCENFDPHIYELLLLAPGPW